MSRLLAPDSERVRRSSLAVLLALGLAIYIVNAPRPALLDDADGCHALSAREILQRHDWVILHVNGIRWLEKPPLHYWLVALSYSLFGQSAFTTRLPLAVAMIALMLLLYEFGRRFFSERAGFNAALVMGTSAGAFLFTRIMIPEVLYALEFTAAFYLFLRAWTGTLDPRVGYWGTAALIGLATLTRAGIGVLFPVAVIGAFLLMQGAARPSSEARRRLGQIPIWSSVAIALAVALPWHIVAAFRAPGFLWFYFINEQVQRALGTRHPADYAAVPLGWWWAAHLVWFFPWVVFLPCWWRGRPRRDEWATTDAAAQAQLLLMAWVTTVFAFFTIVSGSRMEYYSFGAWPAVALLTGLGLTRAESQSPLSLARRYAIVWAIGLASAGLLVSLLWASRSVSGDAGITALLERHDLDFYRLSMATLFELTPQTFAVLRTPAALAALALAGGSAAAFALAQRQRAHAAALAIGAMMAVFCLAANIAFDAFEPRLSSRPLANAVESRLAPDDKLVVYGEFDQACSLSFYLERPALIYNGRYNGLEFGSHFPDAPPIFLDDRRFAALWQSDARVFLFVPPEQRDAVLSHVPASARFAVAEVGDKVLYANHASGASSSRAEFAVSKP